MRACLFVKFVFGTLFAMFIICGVCLFVCKVCCLCSLLFVFLYACGVYIIVEFVCLSDCLWCLHICGVLDRLLDSDFVGSFVMLVYLWKVFF